MIRCYYSSLDDLVFHLLHYEYSCFIPNKDFRLISKLCSRISGWWNFILPQQQWLFKKWVENWIFCSHEFNNEYLAFRIQRALHILYNDIRSDGGSLYHTFTWEKGRKGCQPYFMVLAPFVRHMWHTKYQPIICFLLHIN